MIEGGFKIGKCYRHTGGGEMKIVGAVKSTQFGWTMIAEEPMYGNFKPVASDEASSINWDEITKEEWMQNFS